MMALRCSYWDHDTEVHVDKYRLYGESMEIRDLETREPWAVASERTLLRARGFLNHVFPLDEPYNRFRLCAQRIGQAV